MERRAAARDRKTVRGERIRARSRTSGGYDVRRLRKRRLRLRREGNSPPGDDLFLERQERSQDGSAGVRAGRGQKARALAAEHRVLREFEHGKGSGREGGRGLGARS